jgi:hypothetical protein
MIAAMKIMYAFAGVMKAAKPVAITISAAHVLNQIRHGTTGST